MSDLAALQKRIDQLEARHAIGDARHRQTRCGDRRPPEERAREGEEEEAVGPVLARERARGHRHVRRGERLHVDERAQALFDQQKLFEIGDATYPFIAILEGEAAVLDRAMQTFGGAGVSPDTPLAYFWTWGRAMHLMDGPDEVHLRTVARHELQKARQRMGQTAVYFTTPEQMCAQPHLSA